MFSNALIVGKFAPFHMGHQFLLETALQESQHVTLLVYANPDFSEMPQPIRAGWIRTLYPQVSVLEPLAPPEDKRDDYTHREYVRIFLQERNISVDAVFSSEDYGEGFAHHLGVAHRLVDKLRKNIPISGTVLRNGIHADRDFLSPKVYSHFVKKVVLMGAESTGKSTLAAKLAEVFNTNFMPEYGRQYYEENGGKLILADYVKIAERHRALEDELAEHSNEFLFVDTNAITTLFYSYYYNDGGLPQLHKLADLCQERYFSFYLCADDIPFEQDGWRDNEFLRTKMQRMVKMDLATRGIPCRTLSGSIENRIATVKLDLLGDTT